MGGLKSRWPAKLHRKSRSHPTRDGWIEIIMLSHDAKRRVGPIPHGMGGLKYSALALRRREIKSHPTRDGWIEIFVAVAVDRRGVVPSHTGWVD